MKKNKILKEKNTIQKIFNEKKFYGSKTFTIFILENKSNNTSILITVSKKNGNAVFRNKYKRKVKEIIFNNTNKEISENLLVGYDYVIVVKKNIEEIKNFKEIEKNLIFTLRGVNKNAKNT